MPGEAPAEVVPRWSVAANVVAERPCGPGGILKRSGTKHFRPGAKVSIFGLYAGMCESVAVVGRHRGSQRYVAMVVPARHLQGFRPDLVYSPTVLRLMASFDATGCSTVETREDAERWCAVLPHWRAPDDGRPPAPGVVEGEPSTPKAEDVRSPWLSRALRWFVGRWRGRGP